MKVGVLAPETSWHFQDLNRAAKERGDIKLVSVSFDSLAARINGRVKNFFDQRQSIDSLDALIVRTMPHGSLQQVVFRMDLLHRLSATGIRVVNSPRSVEISIDKFLSLSLMNDEGIDVPPFAVCQTVEQGLNFFDQLGKDVVLKPIFGSMGKHVHHCSDPRKLSIEMEKFVRRGEVIYLQQYIDHDGSDIRIFVSGRQVVAMKRFAPAGQWLTNIAQGGVAKAYCPTSKEVEVAVAAANVNQCDIAGVDLIYAKGRSEPFVLEVNAAPGWEALQRVTSADIAAEILQTVWGAD